MLLQHSLSNFLYVEKVCQGMVEGTILFLMNWTIIRMHYLIYVFSYGINIKKNENF